MIPLGCALMIPHTNRCLSTRAQTRLSVCLNSSRARPAWGMPDAEEFEYEETPWDSEEEGEEAAAVVVPPQPEFATGVLRDGRRFAAVFCSPTIGPLAYMVEAKQMVDTGVLSSDASLGQGATLHAVQKLMRDFDPHILWFVGHGDAMLAGALTLCWTTDSGGVVLIDARVCSAVLSAHTPKRGGSLECVVLNACETMKDGSALGLCAASTRTAVSHARALTHGPPYPQPAARSRRAVRCGLELDCRGRCCALLRAGLPRSTAGRQRLRRGVCARGARGDDADGGP